MENQLTANQMRLITALVANSDVQAACAAADVSRTTAYEWFKETAFQEALARQRDEVFSTALERLKATSARAVAELEKLLDAGDDRLRRQVCNDILGYAWKVRELVDFERRLSALEKATATQNKGGEA